MDTVIEVIETGGFLVCKVYAVILIVKGILFYFTLKAENEKNR
ncbi:hypothetical protein [Treponema socranskii]|nr:hypothetical protein [Treponema socranskii]